MGAVDLILLLVLVLSTLIGLLRGFLFEVMSLAGWVVIYIATQALTPVAADYVPIGSPGSALNHAAAFAATFIVLLILWGLLARLLRGAVQASQLNVADRVLGAGFGFLRGAVILLAFATVVAMTPWERSPAWRDSHGASWLGGALEQIKPLLPREVERHLP